MVTDIPEDIPEWATPEAWADADRMLNKVARFYIEKLARQLEPDNNGRYIVLDASEPLKYELGDMPEDAKKNFRKSYGTGRKAVVLQVGCVVAY